jgi:hypothetical protein
VPILLAMLMWVVFAHGGQARAAEASVAARQVITVTASDLYLCGEGHGGIYGCIDEARSRNLEIVRVRASNAATTSAVHDLLQAVHAEGFEVELDTFFEEPDAAAGAGFAGKRAQE